MLISVIVTTYNWPQALAASLRSLEAQTDKNFEVLVADDGSTQATQDWLAQFQAASHLSIRHVYHQDDGFRAAMIRNKAAAAARGEYLIFLDGDCVVLPSFIARHRQLAEAGFFVPGNRLLLSERYTAHVLQQELDLARQSAAFFVWHWLKRDMNRLLPLLVVPFNAWRYRQPQRWQKAMTCNLGVWRSDFVAVNGFDEVFAGWGYEDSDLVIRLIHAGVKRKEGRFALPVLHLWHRQNDRSQHDENYQRLMQRLAQADLVLAERGVGQYLHLTQRES